jgi:hypothetical protein
MYQEMTLRRAFMFNAVPIDMRATKNKARPSK